jgi:molecular chaperone DnaJ
VPKGSQPDEVLRLKGKGLPVFGAPMRGDMNIRLQIHIPENPTKAEKELYQQLRDIKGKSKKHFWQ